ncbi:MAG TPA: hypothetical protein VFV86_02725 [Nitrososphaeraceae archaeon]|nr:hypothetical protein [Nitrososphaeraceae archaeon]
MQENNTSNKIDEQKLHEFMLKAVGDIGSTMSAMLLIIGDRLAYTRRWQNLESLSNQKN